MNTGGHLNLVQEIVDAGKLLEIQENDGQIHGWKVAVENNLKNIPTTEN